jgi:MYXO-CTERM domain-containing protein
LIERCSSTWRYTDALSPGLPTGSKAGICACVTIGVLALLLLGVLLLKRRRRKPKTDCMPVPEQTPYGVDTKQELGWTSYATRRVKDVALPVAELGAPDPYSDFTSSQPGTRIRDLIASGSFTAGDAEPHTQANLISTEPSPLAAPHAQFEDTVELPGLAASRGANSSVTNPQNMVDAVLETRSVASAPHEASLGKVEGGHDIRQQIKRIREERERLTRINELEILERNYKRDSLNQQQLGIKIILVVYYRFILSRNLELVQVCIHSNNNS